MRQARALAPPRRVPVRLPAPVQMPRPPAPVTRRPAPAPVFRPPAIVLTLRPPAIALALRDSVVALVPRWPAASFADVVRPAMAFADAIRPAIAAALGRAGAASSAALPHAIFGLKLAAGALAAGVAALAVVNNSGVETAAPGADAAAPGFALASSNQTVVVRRPSLLHAPVEEPAAPPAQAHQADQPLSYYQRAIQTVHFPNPNPRVALATAIPESPRGIVKVHGFAAFAPRDVVETEASESIVRRRSLGGTVLDEVDDYLWEVYQRQPIKRDSTGDFTWKDPTAAKRMGLSMADYVIGGMDPGFRERLYKAGRAMDADGIQWSMLSAFRDDYRQRLASGFKASTGNSLHGGSRRTGGYGHGRAIDITTADGDPEVVWKWLDVNGSKYGLHRPLPGPDPAHVQQIGDGGKTSVVKRKARAKIAATKQSRQKRKAKVARAN